MKYKLIYSSRKTLAVQIQRDGEIVVRAPGGVTQKQIEVFLNSHEEWIKKTQDRIIESQRSFPAITDEERKEGMEKAREYIPQRAAYFAEIMGVTYGKITIREQKTRWGSCSAKGNLNFNWKLMRMPPEVLDYVVVHELAHRIEMNHSQRFWNIVNEILPDYQERRRMLREQEKAGK